MVDQIAQKMADIESDPTRVTVRVRVTWMGRICMPDPDGKAEERAAFKVFTFGDNHVIDKATTYDVMVDGRARISATDINEYRRLLLKRCLLSWTLDIPIERENGWLTSACYERVKNVSAPLVDAFIDGFERKISLTKEEEEKITVQGLVLFGKNSRGVMDACEAVGLFCTLGNFWEKFGIGKGVPISEIPYREYVMLKMMIAKEGESVKMNTAPKKPLSRIMGPGGRPHASQGIVMDG